MNLVWMVGIFVVAVLGTIILGLVSKWIDRKVTARVQWRVGPPLLQPLLDIVKLLGKETIVPRQARRAGFLLAPVFGFAAVCVAAALLWAANIRPDGPIPGDLILVGKTIPDPGRNQLLHRWVQPRNP